MSIQKKCRPFGNCVSRNKKYERTWAWYLIMKILLATPTLQQRKLILMKWRKWSMIWNIYSIKIFLKKLQNYWNLNMVVTKAFVDATKIGNKGFVNSMNWHGSQKFAFLISQIIIGSVYCLAGSIGVCSAALLFWPVVISTER